MKRLILAISLLTSSLFAQATGDLIIQKVTLTGATEVYITPSSTRLLGLDGSGNPAVITLGTNITMPGNVLTIDAVTPSSLASSLAINDPNYYTATAATIAAHFAGVDLALASVGAPSLEIDIFVDSEAGNDSYDGATIASPFRTLAKAVASAGANAVIGLKRGSLWRESLDLTTLTAPTVRDYGTDPAPPEITGADIVTSWTIVGGTTYVWSASVAHEGTGSGRLRVYEDGVQLTRVDDQATCDAVPGSFVEVLGSGGTPATVKIRASTGIPTTNGKVYEVTVRNLCIAGPDDAVITGIHTGKAINNNGSVDLVNKTSGTISRVIGELGSKHNIGMGSGVATDSIAVGADTTISAEPSNGQLVAFLNDGTGETAVWRRCGVIEFAPGVDQLAHGNPTSFDSVTLEQCWTVNTGGFTGAADVIRGGYYEGVLTPPVQLGSVSKTIIRLMADGGIASPATYDDATIEDTCILQPQRVADNYNEVFRPNQPHAATFSHVAMFCDTSLSAGNYTMWFANGNSDQDITLNYSVIFYGHSQMRLADGGSYTGDYNVFVAGVPGETNQVVFLHPTAGWCVTLGAWQTATSQDAHSVWLDRADQVRGDGDAFWLGVASDENDGPADGDWRINPNAKVYGGDNTPYTGTFADGTTPITQAGPQTHWDWNARAPAAGPPSAWPNVPATKQDARDYISAPEHWRF